MSFPTHPETPESDDILRLWDTRTAAVADLMGRIAHQWRQPLSTVALIMQDLRDSYAHRELEADYFDRQLALFMREVMFLSHTIDEFRNFFADDAVRNSFAVLLAVKESRSYFFTAENARRINVEITGDDFWLHTYPGEFGRVVAILLENAREAIETRGETFPGLQGHILIETRRTETKKLIRIRDNGGGIPPGTLEKIFDPYFTTKFESRGTGMSLYVAKILTEQRLGGSLHARNGEEGAIFMLEFRE
jgi:nitrogen fixation/metabolism regulation signal transduction histidine kinase